MDTHSKGVVLVSFGSSLSPSKMSPRYQQMFRKAFQRLDMSIIWKWDDDDVRSMPGNVLVKKWLPQNDLLAHPNLRVFVTHGGLLSLQEALYHSVPLVGIPLGADQDLNMIRARRNGYALTLDFDTLTEDLIVEAIQKAYRDEAMHSNMKKMHKIFVDNGLTNLSPIERAANAVDFALKSVASNYTKPAKELLQTPLYVYHGYDVLAFTFTILLILISIALKLVRICLGCIRLFYGLNISEL